MDRLAEFGCRRAGWWAPLNQDFPANWKGRVAFYWDDRLELIRILAPVPFSHTSFIM
jgi:hypothetical protein